jgi:SAM-dependent methyltransferase
MQLRAAAPVTMLATRTIEVGTPMDRAWPDADSAPGDCYSDADAAALYDLVNPWDPARYRSDAFYHGLVMAAASVLDVGCGTGAMLRRARELGHRGRLVGLDPDLAALDRARRCASIEWVTGVAADVCWDGEFDLATMTSHTFQCLVSDHDLAASLAAIHAALRPGGRFAFETRHPQARAWETWTPGNAGSMVDDSGRALQVFHQVEAVTGDVISVIETTADAGARVLRIDRTRLRFLGQPTLSRFLAEASLTVEAQFGDWDRGPVTPDSTEIITVARRS